jgi:hypothetical protein
MYESDGAPYRDDDGVPEVIEEVGVASGDIPWEYCA